MLLLAYRRKPFREGSVGSVCGCPVHGVHLVAERLHGGLDKETGVAVTGAAPYNIRGKTIIPLDDLLDQTLAFFSAGQVGADEMKLLALWVQGRALWMVSFFLYVEGKGKLNTLMSSSAA